VGVIAFAWLEFYAGFCVGAFVMVVGLVTVAGIIWGDSEDER
jgi:hypothetical protein